MSRTLLYQLHLPSELRVFEHAGTPTAKSSKAIVLDGAGIWKDRPIYGRSYCFLDRWLSVYVTFDERLGLTSTGSGFPFAFNCDITTPHWVKGDSIFTTDLLLDVLVQSDGMTYEVTDLEEFEQAYVRGEFGLSWYEGAKRELAMLLDLLDRGQFKHMLTSVQGFPKTSRQIAEQPPRRHLDEAEFRYHPQYPRYG